MQAGTVMIGLEVLRKSISGMVTSPAEVGWAQMCWVAITMMSPLDVARLTRTPSHTHCNASLDISYIPMSPL